MSNSSLNSELINLYQLQEAAQLKFNDAKQKLIDIKRRIRQIEKLLKAGTN
jgi:hypothetical protein